uniref:Ubiquitin carboxyl-terminal hydrolase 36 n=1 Tax=Diabrotica virgifera virgifera TaxID=50390 RepID=A0A6P7FG43_DIAVI
MPASTVDPVNAALRTALSKNESTENLDIQLAGSSKKALLSNIEFESAGSYHNTVLDRLKSKYIVLRSPESPPPSKPEDDMNSSESLKLAKYELFPLSDVQLGWNNCDWSVGAGMVNMGNTCYLNSTLQALFHVPAFVNWLMSDKDHTAICQDSGGLCIICAMRKTLQDSQQRNANSIRPLLIYNKLRLVCRNLIPGRQEDAHEFLRYLVEAMEKAFLSRFNNYTEFDSKVKETTPLNQILGGYLRSAVRCLKCGHVSTTFQHFQDLLLDIRKAQTLDEALELYFSREKLDDESYQCESCQKKVRPISHQAVFNTNAYIMLYELESSPYSPKSAPATVTSKLKTSTPTAETSSVACSSNSSTVNSVTASTKSYANGIGFTSGKVYGPELPPDRIENSRNGYVTSSNGKGESDSSTSSSSEDSDADQVIEKPTVSDNSSINSKTIKSGVSKDKDNDISSTCDEPGPSSASSQRKESPPSSPNVSTSISSLSSPEVTPKKGKKGVVTELFRMSHSGYSAPVSSWNGSRSQLDKEVQNERREDRKRGLPDSSDQGRTKHIKLGSTFKSNPGYNPVQEYHNVKNWNNHNNGGGGGGNYKSFYNGNRHRRMFHHKNFHKNYRYRQ